MLVRKASEEAWPARSVLGLPESSTLETGLARNPEGHGNYTPRRYPKKLKALNEPREFRDTDFEELAPDSTLLVNARSVQNVATNRQPNKYIYIYTHTHTYPCLCGVARGTSEADCSGLGDQGTARLVDERSLMR